MVPRACRNLYGCIRASQKYNSPGAGVGWTIKLHADSVPCHSLTDGQVQRTTSGVVTTRAEYRKPPVFSPVNTCSLNSPAV